MNEQQHCSSSIILSGIGALWKNRQLCDVVITSAGGTQHLAHRIVLAAGSAYFRALFTGAGLLMKESRMANSEGMPVVQLQQFAPQWVQLMLATLYGEPCKVCADSVQPLLELSCYLEVQHLVDACCGYLQQQLSLETCVAVLTLAHRHNCTDLRAEAMSYLSSRLSKLLISEWSATLTCLPLELLLELLASDDLAADSEVDVLAVATRWVDHDAPTRQKHLPQLLSVVRLGLLPSEALLQPASPATSAAVGLIHQHLVAGASSSAMSCPDLLSLQGLESDDGSGVLGRSWGSCGTSPLEGSMLSWEMGQRARRSRRHKPSSIIVAGGHEPGWHSLKRVELYDPHADTWASGPALPSGLSFATSALLEREVYVVGGTMFSSSVARLGQQAQAWATCAPLSTPRVHSAMTAAAGQLYVMGGRSGVRDCLASVECYAVDQDRWRPLPDMCEPRTALAAGCVAGHVYALGGQGGRQVFSTCEVMDPERGTWALLPSVMSGPRKYGAACASGGRLYVVGGMDAKRTRLASAEAYDPREGRWRRLSSMPSARSSCGVAAVGEKLYAVGGAEGDDHILDTVECYVPAADRWLRCASISCPRTGMSVCAL